MRHIQNQENLTWKSKDTHNRNSFRGEPDVGIIRTFFLINVKNVLKYIL